MKAAGVTVYEVEKTPFVEQVASMYAEYDGDPELSALIRAIRECR